LVAKCVFWLFVGCLLFMMFVFSRKRFHQVVLVIALSVVSGVIIRLLSLRNGDAAELVSEAYFLIAIGILYGVVWLGTRYLKVKPK
jgi:hypothetical protein